MTFTAKYSSECAYGDRIRPGEECDYEGDEIAHVECLAFGAAPTKVESVCPSCNLIHQGECF